MADKDEVMNGILAQMAREGITLRDLADAANRSGDIPKARKAGDVAMQVFGWLGGIFILAGIGTYIAMFWNTMPSAMRIFVTLGTGLGLSALSAVAIRDNKYPKLIFPLVILAAIIETGGWFVLIHELFPHGDNFHKAAAVIFAIMSFQQGCMFKVFQRTDLLFTLVIFIYGCFYEVLATLYIKEEHIALLLGGCLIFTSYALARTPHRMMCPLGYIVGACWFNAGLFIYLDHITKDSVAAMLTGLSFCSMSYGLRQAKNSRLSELGFFVGSGMVYAGLYDYLYRTPYELGFLLMAVFMLYGAAVIQSRIILLTSTLAILSFIGDYTAEHFIRSVGWPIALILMGVVFFGVSAVAVKIKRKYEL
jgi:hypothetical protein